MGRARPRAHRVARTVGLLSGEVLDQRTPDLLAPLYGFALLCFFVYCYPINLWTVRLERRFHVRS